jgi:DNA helicase-2/ATP-dependent DNA helicase PcrA
LISLSGLNPQQRLAAETIQGPVLILAGAGSGKTRTITYRIAHMVDNLGIDGKEILAVSFTNKAAKEMRERVHTLLSRKKCKNLTLATFHSLGVRILKKEIYRLGYHPNFSIYDTSDQLALIREAMKIFRTDKMAFDRKVILSKISRLKNLALGPDDWANTRYFDPEDPYDLATEFCYRHYQDQLRFCNAIDFDDILFLTVALFKKFPEVAKLYSQRYQYLMIDEYQDTNPLQFQMALALTSTHNNICVVGDDDQSIYAFRGADISNILSFEKFFPGAAIIKLEENYRSTSSILNLANKVISGNPQRREKTLWGAKRGKAPLLWAMGEADHEAEVVVEDIVQYQSGGGHLGEVAILYRSKIQAAPFEDQLRISGVPYQVIGGQKFYEKKEVKDLMAYLASIHNPADEMALRRILNVPNRGIGQATLDKYLALKEQMGVHLFEAMRLRPDLDPAREQVINQFINIMTEAKRLFSEVKLVDGISRLLDATNYLDYIQKHHDDNPKQAERRKNDVMQFLESADRFQRFFKESATLDNFVERLLLQDSQDRQDLKEDDEDDDLRKNQVTLMTLHSAKGLEFDRVYFIGVEEDTLPHKKVVGESGDIQEERRLCYVGITRAREDLIMTYCKERKLYGKMMPKRKSRFIEWSDEELHPTGTEQPLFVEQDRTTFGHMTDQEVVEFKSKFFGGLIDSLE